jgi:hypothetical protein
VPGLVIWLVMLKHNSQLQKPSLCLLSGLLLANNTLKSVTTSYINLAIDRAIVVPAGVPTRLAIAAALVWYRRRVGYTNVVAWRCPALATRDGKAQVWTATTTAATATTAAAACHDVSQLSPAERIFDAAQA